MDELLKKYIAGNTNREESREVFQWIKQSQMNEQYFKALRRFYDISVWRDDISRSSAVRTVSRTMKIGIVLRIASVFLLIAGLFYFYQQFSLNSQRDENVPIVAASKDVLVPTGKCMKLVLGDGSRVWVNSKSRLVYSSCFNDTERRVHLLGEAYFEVAHDPDRPFIVETQDFQVEVLGTVFNVRAYDDLHAFETSLVEGAVIVRSEHTSEQISLKPSERVTADSEGLKIGHFNKDEFLWREGILSINNKTISEILPLLEQYFDVEFFVKGDFTASNKRYTGKFRIQDGVEHILSVLQLDDNLIEVKKELQ